MNQSKSAAARKSRTRCSIAEAEEAATSSICLSVTEYLEGRALNIAGDLNFNSATSYQYCMEGGGEGDYETWADSSVSCWNDFEDAYGVYYPHVSIGWDNTQRHPSIDTAVLGSTPDAFEVYLRKAKRYLDARPDQTPLLTINSWNEWTEGSYLLPDKQWGYGYLQAVGNVFLPGHSGCVK